MHLSYFVTDSTRQLRRVPREALEAYWRKAGALDELGCAVDDELRLITVLSDDEFAPVVCYFARFDLEGGRITDDSRVAAYEAMTSRHRRRYDHPAAQAQFTGWPADWQRQLAVALDVPAAALTKLGLGGPLLMSDLWGIPLEKVLEYFEEAYQKE